MDRITKAIDALYRTFAARPPTVIEGCPCCIGTRRVDVLLSTPLRQISGHALWRYVSGAFLTIGDQRDFRYLLPRIFEISAREPGNANDPPIVLGKLARAGWRSWRVDEQQVIEEFIHAWLDQALTDDVAGADDGWIEWQAEKVLCGAVHAGMPLDGLLQRLDQPGAALVVVDMHRRFGPKPLPFWENIDDAYHAVRTFCSQRVA